MTTNHSPDEPRADSVPERLASLRELSWDRPAHQRWLERRLLNVHLGRHRHRHRLSPGVSAKAALFLGLLLAGGVATGTTAAWIYGRIRVDRGESDGRGNCRWIVTDEKTGEQQTTEYLPEESQWLEIQNGENDSSTIGSEPGAEMAGEPDAETAQDGSRPNRSAREIVAEFEANPSPGFDFSMDAKRYDALLRRRLSRQCELALELWKEHPSDHELGRLLFARWMNLLNFFHEPARVRLEAGDLLASPPLPELTTLARFARAGAAILEEDLEWKEVAADVDAAVACDRSPQQAPGWKVELLLDFARRRTADSARQHELLARALASAEGPDERAEVKRVERVLAHVGEKLELDVPAAGDGVASLRAADLRGRVVLLHLWSATAATAEEDLADVAQLDAELGKVGGVRVTLDPWTSPEQLADVRASAARLGVTQLFAVDTRGFDETWARRFGLFGTPQILLIDKEGRLVALVARAVALEGAIARAVAAPRSSVH